MSNPVIQIIPVIDLKQALVVRGIAGNRQQYRPIQSQIANEPTPTAIAQAFARLGFNTVYVADLDAIAGQAPDWSAYEQIRAAGLALWIDAGMGTAKRVIEVQSQMASHDALIVGLETLASVDELRKLVNMLTPARTIFSLDLKAGQPITTIDSWTSVTPEHIAFEAIECGIQRMIVLDLADVGVGRGTGTLDLVQRLRTNHSHLELIAGGGVRSSDDLARLSAAGGDAALVASALHDGTLLRK